MEGLLKKLFDEKLGDFLKVDAGNVQFSPSEGRLSLRQAEFKADVFDRLHFPFALRGGFIEEITVNVSATGFFGSEAGAKVVVKNVFLVLSPHVSDWSWQTVCECKAKLVDLIMKVYELKGSEKKETSSQGGYFFDIRQRIQDDIARSLFGMLEVSVSGIHIRYEDPLTQSRPFACGFKIGFVGVTSTDNESEAMGVRGRATGDWKHSNMTWSDPLFSQTVKTRRISAYWDIGKETIFDGMPVAGQQVRKSFMRLNIRETFSACVVEKILAIFPADHRRRKYLDGPSFRERLDFHQYVIYPASINAHVVATRLCEATRQERAPLKDADVEVEPVEVALDTDQVQSMNELLAHAKEFQRKDKLFRTRPRESIHEYLVTPGDGHMKSSSSFGPGLPSGRYSQEHLAKRRQLVRAWWVHAFQGVRELCAIPRAWNAEDLRGKAQLQERFVNLCLEELSTGDHPMDVRIASHAGPTRKLREMQMSLELPDILQWRQHAREVFHKRRGAVGAGSPFKELLSRSQDGVRERAGFSTDPVQHRDIPESLQVQVHFKAFNLFFLVCADANWGKMVAKNKVANGKALSKDGGTHATMRQLVVKSQVMDVRFEAVQKGHKKRRLARWIELSVGSISASNLSAQKMMPSVRSIFTVHPFEQEDKLEPQVCLYLGATTFECHDRHCQAFDTPLSAVLEPWRGLASHLKAWPKEETPEQLRRLGFLRDFKDEPGKLMTFAFVRVGLVRALDYAPFRRQLMLFLEKGQSTMASDLIRRPSPVAMDKTLMNKLQKKVELMVGKSDTLGTVDIELDGMRARLVDHYNTAKALCKEVGLAPMAVRLLRHGCPQAFQMQLRRRATAQDASMQRIRSTLSGASNGSLDLLPFKVSMHLLPKADFAMSIFHLEADSNPKSGHSMSLSSSEGMSCVAKGRSGADVVAQSTVARRMPTVYADLPLPPAYFRKWGRNGRCRQRFVFYDEGLQAVAWKSIATAKSYLGAIPLVKIQDICIGIKTPVLKNVSQAYLRADCCWSIVASNRTLDLEADSDQVMLYFVTWLRAKYKSRAPSFPADISHHGIADMAAAVVGMLPKALERKTKSYPAMFRPANGELCGLKSTCKKLQAVGSLGTALEAHQGKTKAKK
mmetsp:Transcript_18077/g.58466  ORF Transcript_18077/g.58466 Transcript_18077/m.58466 type:complete len:1127 (+) Transcript_18077:66-3446(+)